MNFKNLCNTYTQIINYECLCFITYPNITGFSIEHPDMCDIGSHLYEPANFQLHKSQSFSHIFQFYIWEGMFFPYEVCALLPWALRTQGQACQRVL